MKPVLVDMKEMSDSREVYESRPHPFFVGFIYLILGMVIAAVMWAAFFQMDIVVIGKGVIAPRGNYSTVTNTKAGIVAECYIADGQTVKEGDPLYEIEHEDLDLQRKNYENQKFENAQRLEMLQIYLEWLSNETTALEAYEDNPYYTEYLARSRLVTLNIEAARQEYENEQDSYETKLESGENLITYYEGEIAKLAQLSDAVKNRNNPFSSEDTYYYAKANDYLTQYQNTEAQYNAMIAGLQQEIDAAGEKMAALQSAGEDADRETLAAQLQETVKEKQREIESAQIQQLIALTNLQTNTIASIESASLTYQQNLVASQGTQAEVQSTIENIAKMGIADAVENIRQTEIQAITAEISSCGIKSDELETALLEIERNVGNAVVCAPISGVINFTEEPVIGNYLPAGSPVLTIIPEDGDGYRAESYIENQDIAKIHEDMPVKYEIAAYPSREYGILAGEVEFVSADLKASNDTGSAYYVVETTINDTDLYNESGEKMKLKVGMLCEVKIIVEQKSVLQYVLEKIKLID